MQHTPGPWRVSSTRPTQIMDDHGICIAECLDRGTETPFPEANARLIAAAPELLEALDTLFDITPFATNDKDAEIRVRIRALIRKAKGL